MNKITYIKKEKSKYVIKIVTDYDEKTFKISEDLLIESKFISLKEISDEELKNFLNKLPADSLLLEALKYTDKKMRTKKEVIDHLKEVTSSMKLIEPIIEKLEKMGLINDKKYFDLLINYLVYEKLEGPLKIFQELHDLGLDSFGFNYDRADIKDNINTLLKKFNQKDNSTTYQTKVLKAKRFLASKGYSVDTVNNFFNYSLIKVEDELSNLSKDLERMKRKEIDSIKLKNKLLQKGYKLEDIEEALNG